jgi:cell shape-determining protein MreC
MSYLLDKKLKRKKNLYIIIGTLALFLLFYFRVGISNSLSYVSHSIFRPFLIFGNNIGKKVSDTRYLLFSKNSLLKENEILKIQINQSESRIANYNSILDENIKLKETLGRKKDSQNMIVSAILSKPNRSPYDVLIIDTGINQGILVNKKVFALGNIPIGRIAETYANSSKVILYSNPEEKTEVIVSGGDTFMQAIGRGGGNFEILLPKDFNLENGTEIVIPGIYPYLLGTVVKTLSDPRDSFGKVLIVSPVNVQNLKFVEIEK